MYVLPLQPYIFLLKLILEIRASHATYGVLDKIQVLALFFFYDHGHGDGLECVYYSSLGVFYSKQLHDLHLLHALHGRGDSQSRDQDPSILSTVQ